MADSWRFLCVHPGASWSTSDVFTGLTSALSDAGHEVHVYPLDQRIAWATQWLRQYATTARENGNAVEDPTPAEIIFEANADIINRAAVLGVDAILLISAMYTPLAIMKAMRRLRCPVGLVLTESPYDLEQEVRWAAEADIVWTNERTSVDVLRAANPRTYYLPAAYNPAVHTSEPQPGDDDLPAHDVVMIGTGFPERIELLEAVDWTGIDLGLYGNWDALRDDSPLLPFVRGGVIDNGQTAALYRRAKIGLNLYRTSIGFGDQGHITRAESLNPRAYELAACHIHQVSQWREEIADVFNHACVGTFDGSATHLEQVIRQRLRWSWERELKNRHAAFCIQPHTFTARAAQLLAEFAPVIDRQYAAAYG